MEIDISKLPTLENSGTISVSELQYSSGFLLLMGKLGGRKGDLSKHLTSINAH